MLRAFCVVSFLLLAGCAAITPPLPPAQVQQRHVTKSKPVAKPLPVPAAVAPEPKLTFKQRILRNRWIAKFFRERAE